ncbi:MAG: RsmD family RNA methyltransferase, partial [Eubacteriales bacterium]
MMRIITGSAKGVRLATLDGENTRPTTERAKEAVFSMLQFDIEGRRVLDLFAGSGQMGLEALSRGAASAVMVDHAKAAVEIIHKNIEKTKLEGAGVV